MDREADKQGSTVDQPIQADGQVDPSSALEDSTEDQQAQSQEGLSPINVAHDLADDQQGEHASSFDMIASPPDDQQAHPPGAQAPIDVVHHPADTQQDEHAGSFDMIGGPPDDQQAQPQEDLDPINVPHDLADGQQDEQASSFNVIGGAPDDQQVQPRGDLNPINGVDNLADGRLGMHGASFDVLKTPPGTQEVEARADEDEHCLGGFGEHRRQQTRSTGSRMSFDSQFIAPNRQPFFTINLESQENGEDDNLLYEEEGMNVDHLKSEFDDKDRIYVADGLNGNRMCQITLCNIVVAALCIMYAFVAGNIALTCKDTIVQFENNTHYKFLLDGSRNTSNSVASLVAYRFTLLAGEADYLSGATPRTEPIHARGPMCSWCTRPQLVRIRERIGALSHNLNDIAENHTALLESVLVDLGLECQMGLYTVYSEFVEDYLATLSPRVTKDCWELDEPKPEHCSICGDAERLHIRLTQNEAGETVYFDTVSNTTFSDHWKIGNRCAARLFTEGVRPCVDDTSLWADSINNIISANGYPSTTLNAIASIKGGEPFKTSITKSQQVFYSPLDYVREEVVKNREYLDWNSESNTSRKVLEACTATNPSANWPDLEAIDGISVGAVRGLCQATMGAFWVTSGICTEYIDHVRFPPGDTAPITMDIERAASGMFPSNVTRLLRDIPPEEIGRCRDTLITDNFKSMRDFLDFMALDNKCRANATFLHSLFVPQETPVLMITVGTMWTLGFIFHIWSFIWHYYIHFKCCRSKGSKYRLDEEMSLESARKSPKSIDPSKFNVNVPQTPSARASPTRREHKQRVQTGKTLLRLSRMYDPLPLFHIILDCAFICAASFVGMIQYKFSDRNNLVVGWEYIPTQSWRGYQNVIVLFATGVFALLYIHAAGQNARLLLSEKRDSPSIDEGQLLLPRARGSDLNETERVQAHIKKTNLRRERFIRAYRGLGWHMLNALLYLFFRAAFAGWLCGANVGLVPFVYMVSLLRICLRDDTLPMPYCHSPDYGDSSNPWPFIGNLVALAADTFLVLCWRHLMKKSAHVIRQEYSLNKFGISRSKLLVFALYRILAQSFLVFGLIAGLVYTYYMDLVLVTNAYIVIGGKGGSGQLGNLSLDTTGVQSYSSGFVLQIFVYIATLQTITTSQFFIDFIEKNKVGRVFIRCSKHFFVFVIVLFSATCYLVYFVWVATMKLIVKGIRLICIWSNKQKDDEGATTKKKPALNRQHKKVKGLSPEGNGMQRASKSMAVFADEGARMRKIRVYLMEEGIPEHHLFSANTFCLEMIFTALQFSNYAYGLDLPPEKIPFFSWRFWKPILLCCCSFMGGCLYCIRRCFNRNCTRCSEITENDTEGVMKQSECVPDDEPRPPGDMFQNPVRIRCEWNHTEASVAHSLEKNRIYISFRGTIDLENWITNTQGGKTDAQDVIAGPLTPKSWQKHPPGVPEWDIYGKVHRGFLTAMKSVEYDILTAVQERFALMPDSKTTMMMVTGHSLGGALGCFMASRLGSLYGRDRVHLVTFGAPRVGDEDFKRYFDKTVRTYWRVVQRADIVTKVSPTGLGYKSLGTVVHVESGDLVVEPGAFERSVFHGFRVKKFFNNHLLQGYFISLLVSSYNFACLTSPEKKTDIASWLWEENLKLMERAVEYTPGMFSPPALSRYLEIMSYRPGYYGHNPNQQEQEESLLRMEGGLSVHVD
uniref:Fungal lipase-type domain-containing protein n=1 Tax=Mucochytrium quahogii TaxID=96639 RepID=A0A7S2RP50_9STRA|mmetsp:Transcript_10589/g.19859  ORF Transcript_10589/g.19859 Transcript_10589/m.19859 type:complete len:1690 (-) Transcript_10589:19-5088(-)